MKNGNWHYLETIHTVQFFAYFDANYIWCLPKILILFTSLIHTCPNEEDNEGDSHRWH